MADLGKAIEGVQLKDDVLRIRRIVTGHDRNGTAIFVEDKLCPNRFALGGCENFGVCEMWRQTETPADNDGEYVDTAAGNFNINPGENGNVFRIMQFQPDGEVWAVIDGGETLMKKGDVLIQRGTIHAWSNRSDKPCTILFVLSNAKRAPGMEYK